jgi:hypothetical protein
MPVFSSQGERGEAAGAVAEADGLTPKPARNEISSLVIRLVFRQFGARCEPARPVPASGAERDTGALSTLTGVGDPGFHYRQYTNDA